MALTRNAARTTPLRALAMVFGVSFLFGVPVYFIAFLFAYGFRDTIGPADHAAFLVMITIFAIIVGALQVFVSAPVISGGPGRRAAFGVLACLSLNSAVVCVGSVISAMHKAENSVSANFSTRTDVLVATSLFLAAIAFAICAHRVSPYRSRSSMRH